MRSKKLSRQLKKSFEYEEIDSELPAIQAWVAAQPETAAVPEGIKAFANNIGCFLDVIDTSYEENATNLEHAQRSLEVSSQEVEERNKLLRIENKKTSDLLNNMRQAVFSVDPAGMIVAPVSKFADAVFGHSLVGKSVYSEVYADLDQKSEEYASLKSAMTGVFGETDLQWDLMFEYFPTRACVYPEGKTGDVNFAKILKVSVNPIWDENAVLERVMFIVEDVTEVEKLEKRMAEEKAKSGRKLRIVQELVAVPRPQLAEFLVRSRELARDSRKYMSNDSFDLNLVFRNLHTVKGNARGYKFQYISNSAHQVESMIAECRGNPKLWDDRQNDVFKLLADLENELSDYANLAESVLGLKSDSSRKDQVLTSAASTISAEAIVAKLVPLVNKLKPQLKSAEVEQFEAIFEQATEALVRPGLDHLASVANDLARELHKTIKIDVVDQGNASFNPAGLAAVQDAMMHIVRNSVDHGIETDEQRKASGKTGGGRIRIECFEKQDQVVFAVTDDGRGLDEHALVARAQKMGLIDTATAQKMSKQEKFHLVFAPGFTTKTEVTEISGRGAGLDAAITQIEKLGGHIGIASELGKGTTFQIVIDRRKARHVTAAA